MFLHISYMYLHPDSPLGQGLWSWTNTPCWKKIEHPKIWQYSLFTLILYLSIVLRIFSKLKDFSRLHMWTMCKPKKRPTTTLLLYQPQNYMEKASLPSWALVPGTEILLQVTIFKWSWHLENRTRNVTDKLCDVTKHASLIAGRKRISQQNTAIYILSESRGGGDIQTVRDNFTVVSRKETQREKWLFLKRLSQY